MKRAFQLILCLACLFVFNIPTTSAQLNLTEDGTRVEVCFNNTLKAMDLEILVIRNIYKAIFSVFTGSQEARISQ